MNVKKKEQESLLKTWIAASILLHLLILLLAFFWYLQDILKQKLAFRMQDKEATATPVTPSPPKKQLMQQHPATYTLIPGKKAVTTPTTTTPSDEKEKQTTQKQEHIIEKPPIEKEQPITSQSKFSIPKPTQKQELTPLELLQKKLKKEAALSEEKKEKEPAKLQPQSDQDPTIQKPKVTLQDLKLGFSKFLHQEGNNDLLIQHGKKEPNDPQALKFITYNQQLARCMREAILTHEKWKNITHQHGKRIQFTLTIDRSGKLIDLQLRQSSTDRLLDQVTMEALKSIKLYPPLPKHITQDPYTMPWTLLF